MKLKGPGDALTLAIGRVNCSMRSSDSQCSKMEEMTRTRWEACNHFNWRSHVFGNSYVGPASCSGSGLTEHQV